MEFYQDDENNFFRMYPNNKIIQIIDNLSNVCGKKSNILKIVLNLIDSEQPRAAR